MVKKAPAETSDAAPEETVAEESPRCVSCGVAFGRSDMPDADQCGNCLPPVPVEASPAQES